MSSLATSDVSQLVAKLDILQSQISELNRKLDDHLMTCRRENQQQIQPANMNSQNEIDATNTVVNQYSEPRKIQRCANDAVDSSNDTTTPKIYCTDSSIRPDVPRQIFTQRLQERRLECLRKSLKQNIVLLVDSLPYTEADVLDMLLETDCLTETECCDLSYSGSRKDVVRNLIRIIKGRSFEVMKVFVDCVKKLHPEIAASIWQSYEKLLKENKIYSKVCTFCFLKRSVNLKFLADYALRDDAISDELYDEIVGEDSPANILWGKFANECNHLERESRRIFLQKLTEVLVKKGQYKELVLKLNKVSSLKCLCISVDKERTRFTGTLLDTGAIGLPSIVVTNTENNSTVSPASTTASSDSFNSVASDDDVSANVHENYFISSLRPNDREKDMYNSRFGIRKGSGSLLQFAIAQEFPKSRSNSFAKITNDVNGNRRASMFM